MDALPEQVAESSRTSRGQAGILKDLVTEKVQEAARVEQDGLTERPPRKSREQPADPKRSAPADTGQGDVHAEGDEGKPAKVAVKPSQKDQAKAPEADTKAKAESDPKTGEDHPMAMKSWSQEERAAYEAAPAEVKQAIDKLVRNIGANYTKKTMAIAEAKRVADDFTSALQPHHRSELQARGVTGGQMFKEFLGVYDTWKRNPVEYLRGVMRNAGISVEQLIGQQIPNQGDQAQPQGQAHADPQVQRMQQELEALKSTWNTISQAGAQRQQQAELKVVSECHNVLEQFQNEVDESGTPRHPHFDALKEHIAYIIAHDPSLQELQDARAIVQSAYDKAIWANPEIRQSLLEQEKQKTSLQLEAQRSRNAVSVKPRLGGGPGGAVTTQPTRLQDIVARNVKKFS